MKEVNKPVTGETEEQPQVEKLPKAKRTALVRYLAILFVFAFLIVLLSLFLQYRSSASKQISDLTSASNSAIAKAEQLQEENRELEKTAAELEERARKIQQEHEKELEGERLVYDALVRLLADPEKSDDPRVDEDVKTVRDGLDKLSGSAREAFAAYEEETQKDKREEA